MRPATRRWLYAGLGVLLIGAGSFGVAPLNGMRETYHLTAAPIPDSANPYLLSTPMLAVGRALAVDYLWLRAMKLKDEGRFFDAYQLTRAICDLQPRFASVWAFHAWNMAYNISVTLKTPEERWRWVRNGIELLRDKGIVLNPNNTQLHRELAWIFFHKVGDFQDEQNGYYKLQLALMVEDILGTPPDDFVRPGRVRGDFYRDYDYRSLADAAGSWEELRRRGGVAEFVDRLRSFGFDASKPGAYLGLLAGIRDGTAKVPDAVQGEAETRLKALRDLMGDPATADARTAIERYWRAYRLRTELKMEPERILAIQKDIGIGIDFRLAEAHALYWATMGLERGADDRTLVDIHRLNTNRLEFFCLQKMFHRGRLAMSRSAHLGEPPLLSPDIRFGEILFDVFRREVDAYRKANPGRPEQASDFFGGFVGFVRLLVLRYAELNQRDKAMEKYEFLKKEYPDPVYEGGFDAFLMYQFKVDRDLNDYKTALARIEALCGEAVLNSAYDEDEEAARFLARARQIYKAYQDEAVTRRVELPFDFQTILKNVLEAAAGGLSRASYENACAKLGFEPLPAPGAGAPP